MCGRVRVNGSWDNLSHGAGTSPREAAGHRLPAAAKTSGPTKPARQQPRRADISAHNHRAKDAPGRAILFVLMSVLVAFAAAGTFLPTLCLTLAKSLCSFFFAFLFRGMLSFFPSSRGAYSSLDTRFLSLQRKFAQFRRRRRAK